MTDHKLILKHSNSVEWDGETFYFLRNCGNYRVFYNEKNHPLKTAAQRVKSGVFYLGVWKKSGKLSTETVEWKQLGKLNEFLDWLGFLEASRRGE